MLFLHLPSATDDCTSLAFQTMGVRDLAVAFHHGHRCSKSNQLPRTNEILSCVPCALLAQCSTTQTWVCTWTHPSPHNKFRTTRPVLHPASIVPDIDLQPFSQEFSCHDDFLHAVEFPHVVCVDLDAAKLPSAPRSAGHCSSIMDAVFIPTCCCTVVRVCVC